MKKQDGPTADEFRLLEQKWVSFFCHFALDFTSDEVLIFL